VDRAATPGQSTTTRHFSPFPWSAVTRAPRFETVSLALDMIADWKNDCSNDDERLDLLDHIALRYAAEDFDEPEHFNSVGEPILPYSYCVTYLATSFSSGWCGNKGTAADGRPERR